jgi:glycosyltransferase involved in cell wall biosynthesis
VVVSGAVFCGISTLLNSGVEALFLENPRDAAAIASSITRILNDEHLRQSLMDAGLRFAAQHQWTQAVARYVQIYGARFTA